MAENFLISALEQLRLKLFDLTGRNRLINFRHTPGKSLQFVECQLNDLYQKLVESNSKASVNIVALPEPLKRDWIEKNGRLQRPEIREWASANNISLSYDLDPNATYEDIHLRALLYPDDCSKHCRKIEREANLAIEETGANMLFLVLGFLEYPDQRSSDKLFQAPLVSVPVALQKREVSGIQQFSISFTGDEIAENLSLREKLKNDYGVLLPALNEDEIQIDEYLKEIHKIIKNQPDFSVKHRASLCLLSFSNMLLVRDLDPDKWPNINSLNHLLDHPIVKQVFEGSEQNVLGGISKASEYLVDEGVGSRLALVYDADSSQHSALIDALVHKKNLVIEGPPGTGKSQTITNLIAASIAEGKKVLFVAEKMAALEVVKNRLALAGLDAFILELHSNKSNKKRVLEEIGKRIKYKATNQAELPRLQQELEKYRSELKAYTDLVNSVSQNALGLTLHQIMWRAERNRLKIADIQNELSQIEVAEATEITEFDLNSRTECLNHLSSLYATIDGYDVGSTFWGYSPKNLVPGDEDAIRNIFSLAYQSKDVFQEDLKIFEAYLGENITGLNYESCSHQLAVIRNFLQRADNLLPYALVGLLFSIDETGKRAENAISEIKIQIQEYHQEKLIVDQVIKDESLIDSASKIKVAEFIQTAKLLGVKVSSLKELEELAENIKIYLEKIRNADQQICEFSTANNIAYDGSYKRIMDLHELATLITNAPTSHFELQSAGIHQPKAVDEIQRLKNLVDRWRELKNKLQDQVYLDILPSKDELRSAISVLREGNAWYRIFQSRWRKAIGLHKSLQKSKRPLSAIDRLTGLEEINQLLIIRDQSNLDPAWQGYLELSPPQDPLDISDYLIFATWSRDLRKVINILQINSIDLTQINSSELLKLQGKYQNILSQLKIALSTFDLLINIFPKITEFNDSNTICGIEKRGQKFDQQLNQLIELMSSNAMPTATVFSFDKGIEAVFRRADLLSKLDQNTYIKSILGKHYQGMETNCDDFLKLIVAIQELFAENLNASIKKILLDDNFLDALVVVEEFLSNIEGHLKTVNNLIDSLSKYGEFNCERWVGYRLEQGLSNFVNMYGSALEQSIDNYTLLLPWSIYLNHSDEGFDLGLSTFIELMETKKIAPEQIAYAYKYCIYSNIIRAAFKSIPQLGRFSGLKHNQIRNEFQRLDKEIISLRGKQVGFENIKNVVLPSGRSGARVDDKTEMVLLDHLIQQQRPRMPVRKFLIRAGASIQTLKPCFMMGPQAVAQYLTPGAMKFDLVIMDEASQLRPEEAIGAIARGTQLVVVGDPKQLPPTSFFSRIDQSLDNEEEFTTTDAESILDVCASHFKPVRSLRWHYRSQHHSLIAFSNRHFYRNDLIVFPSPYDQNSKLGVRTVYLEDAVYENNTNLREAKRVVDAVVDHINTRSRESLGVVTLNIKQRDLISELLEERLKSVNSSAEYREYWTVEGQPLFVKNLENVQGDERDAIIISTTFGKAPGTNVVRQSFGPINQQGGWRRLNVLFTRAKKSVSIYTSMRPEDIVLDGITPEGRKALRNYLEFARTGLLDAAQESDLEPDSDFEISVIDILKNRGYEVTPQLGVAGYRIDIAVKHPKHQGIYLAAIECDGATYHSALSVRDRDRIRQEILESLGWRGRIWRIWSTDWFRSPRQEIEKLFQFLDNLQNTWNPDHVSGEKWIKEYQSSLNDETIQSDNYIQATLDLEQERDEVKAVLIEDIAEVEVGDTVKYVDLEFPGDTLTIQIVSGPDNFENGIINQSRPLAQIMLGSSVGDEVLLHFPNKESKTFHILEILKLK